MKATTADARSSPSGRMEVGRTTTQSRPDITTSSVTESRSTPRTLHVISTMPWIADSFAEALAPRIDGGEERADRNDAWRVVRHELWRPAADMVSAIDDDPDAALWIAPAALVALNFWRRQHGLRPWNMRSPGPRWMERLPMRITGRRMINVTARELRGWSVYPDELGDRPWSQLCDGRVEGFNAARRDIATLHTDLRQAPDDTLLTLHNHLTGISEEWNVVVHRGEAVASSGYCLHRPPESHRIVTIFDMDTARRYSHRIDPQEAADDSRGTGIGAMRDVDASGFHESYRRPAERIAQEACARGGLDEASVLVAFRSADEAAVVLEATAVWCSTPYPYSRPQMLAVLEAMAVSRCSTPPVATPLVMTAPLGGHADTPGATAPPDNQTVYTGFARNLPAGERIFTPSSWMRRHYEGLFRGSSDFGGSSSSDV